VDPEIAPPTIPYFFLIFYSNFALIMLINNYKYNKFIEYPQSWSNPGLVLGRGEIQPSGLISVLLSSALIHQPLIWVSHL
jgi:hypothetical protein